MWQILKTEFRYTRDALIVAYTIAALFLAVALIRDDYGIYNYMWNTTIIYFIFMGITGSAMINEKRYRQFATLPVRAEQVATVDGLYVLLVQLGMCPFWILYLLITGDPVTPQVFWAMVAGNAAILCVVTLFGIHYHFGFFGTKTYKRIDWAIIFALLLTMIGLGYFGKLDDVSRYIWRHYASGQGALITALLWVGLSGLCSAVFVRRKSYLA